MEDNGLSWLAEKAEETSTFMVYEIEHFISYITERYNVKHIQIPNFKELFQDERSMKCAFHRKYYKNYHCALADARLCSTSCQIISNEMGYITEFYFPYQKEEYQPTPWDQNLNPRVFNDKFEYLYTQNTDEFNQEVKKSSNPTTITPTNWEDPEWNDDKWKKVDDIWSEPSFDLFPNSDHHILEGDVIDEYYGDDYENDEKKGGVDNIEELNYERKMDSEEKKDDGVEHIEELNYERKMEGENVDKKDDGVDNIEEPNNEKKMDSDEKKGDGEKIEGLNNERKIDSEEKKGGVEHIEELNNENGGIKSEIN